MITVYVLIQDFLGEIEILGIFQNEKDAKTVRDAYNKMKEGWDEFSKTIYRIEEYGLN